MARFNGVRVVDLNEFSKLAGGVQPVFGFNICRSRIGRSSHYDHVVPNAVHQPMYKAQKASSTGLCFNVIS